MSACDSTVQLYMPWSYATQDEERFKRIVKTNLAVFLILSILLPILPLSIVEDEVIIEPPRIVKLLFEKKLIPPPPKPEPLVRKPKPLPKKTVKKTPVRKPVQVDKAVAARKKAEKSGLLALSDSLSDLRQNTIATSLRKTTALSHSGGRALKTEHAVLTSATTSTSNGINTARLSKNTGGGQLASRATTRVHSPTGNAAGAGKKGKGVRSAGRSIEEIQMIFDRNKGTIYNVYNRALRKNPSLQGKIVLQLTIAPSGKVLACTLISSELDDPSLGQNITRRVKLFDFGAKEVSEVTITYPIDFFPV